MRAVLMQLCSMVLLLVASGCAGLGVDPNTLYVDYVCTPQGATLYQAGDNTNRGACPTTLTYKITDADRARGYAVLRGMTAYWVSGASSSVSSINAYLANGLHQNFHFERPRNIPGYDVDANYALNLEKNQLLGAQMQAAQVSAAASVVAAANAAAPAAPAPRLGTRCTTTNIAGTLYTNCY
jgi:hypothetical protein